MRNFREYDIWKSAINIAKEIYILTEQFPNAEKFGLISQIQRAAVSIASNIAEGASRVSEKEFSHFLQIALGSAFEVETQIVIATEIGYIKLHEAETIVNKLQVLQKQLYFLIAKLKQ